MKNLGKQPLLGRKGSVFFLLVLVAITFTLALYSGSSFMNFDEFIGGMLARESYKTQSTIIYLVRMPRILACVLAGIGLSVSGVLLQSVTGNELASPNIIGVNSGAGFMVILTLSFFPSTVYVLPITAFVGAFLVTLLIVSLASRIGTSKSSIILTGIACTTVLNAGISFISLIDNEVLSSYNSFSIGGFGGVRTEGLILPTLIIFMSLVISLITSKRIDVLCLGDGMAVSLGVRVKLLRTLCLICASASAAAVVSFAGLLGFVGLVVPHISRRLVGNNAKHLLINSSLVGAILVILADLLGRVVFAPTEVPVGIVMAFLGAPFFFGLLMKKRGEVNVSN